MVSDGTDEELNKHELYFPQVFLQQEAAILYFILKLLVIRRAVCRLHLQISLINMPTYTRCESWTVKKAERQRIDAFFLFYFFKLYIIVLVLPNIKMNPPQV